MNLRNFVLSVLSVFAIGSQAHADLLLEPYLGYHLSGKHEFPGGGDKGMTGVTLGGRVGFQQLGFMVGGDYMTGVWKVDSSPSSDSTPSDLGIFVGYEFPIMLRVYGTYNFQSNNTLKVSNLTDKYEGTGYKLGVGFTALPFLVVNLEYRASKYSKIDGNSIPGGDTKDTSFGLSVSLPFVL